MDPSTTQEADQATRHQLERSKPSRSADRWPDDGLPPRFEGRNRSSVHPFAVAARALIGD